MRRAAKVDANHRAVVTAFRALGCTVQSLAAVGAGVPDLLVGLAGQNYLVEVKDGRKAKSARLLTPAQVKWRESWRGRTCLVESVDEAKWLVELWQCSVTPSLPEFDASDYERPAKGGA